MTAYFRFISGVQGVTLYLKIPQLLNIVILHIVIKNISYALKKCSKLSALLVVALNY